MLNFFRKHQKFFFLFTTIIVVSSFVFFGTYQAIAPSFGRGGGGEEETSYASQMVRFLNTEQWMISRKLFGANFLNDGVLSKEFLETGIADLIATHYGDALAADFNERLAREKGYTPYVHPYLPTLSAESIWGMFAPELPSKLKKLQSGKGDFKARKELFLAQKNFPPAFLTQIIRYQEQNHSNFPPDHRLARDDLALFGYQDLTDWFGPNFLEVSARLITDMAKEARRLGFKVSKEEVMAELLSRSQETFLALKQKIDLPIEDGYSFFQVYLRQLGMREETVVKIWEEVTLFRRLLHSVGDGALTDALPLSDFYAYAYENAIVELYQMPQELRLQNGEELKKLEAYLAAVSEKRESPLDMPADFASIETIEAKYPELVGRRYSLYFAETSKKALQALVSVKETLQWECDPANWNLVQKQFPELASKEGTPFDILENMDEKGRKLVDTFARKQIVAANPQWIHEALVNAEMREKQLFLSLNGKTPFEGIGESKPLASCLESQDELMDYSHDGEHYYRFLVMDRSDKEVLSYKEALKLGVLDTLVQKMDGDSLVKAVAAACPADYKEKPYAYRFAAYLTKHKYSEPQGALAKQFQVEKKEKTITRSEKSFISLDEVLTLEPGAFSSLKIDAKEGAYLYRFVEKKGEKSLPLEKMVQTQELLSKEARCRYFEKFLENRA